MSSTTNPFESVLQEAKNHPLLIRDVYQRHRETRATQQREIFLAPDFEGVIEDAVLQKLEGGDSTFKDERNGIVFSAKPPEGVKNFLIEIQEALKNEFTGLWTTPPSQLHLTALEITHSQPYSSLTPYLDSITPILDELLNYTLTDRTTLDYPMLTFDRSAVAISFLPQCSPPSEPTYTYHHLRRDLYALAEDAGVPLAARYVVPSAHVTIARFLHRDEEKSFPEKFVKAIERLNKELKVRDIEWKVGEGQGLDLRIGPNWYGGGETIKVGKGY